MDNVTEPTAVGVRWPLAQGATSAGNMVAALNELHEAICTLAHGILLIDAAKDLDRDNVKAELQKILWPNC